MRLWSLHQKYLDQQGICGLWREAIMAKNALEQGKDHSYHNHPQLDRFKSQSNPTNAIDRYLLAVWDEAASRGYSFDLEQIDLPVPDAKISVTDKQIKFEKQSLLNKLQNRFLKLLAKNHKNTQKKVKRLLDIAKRFHNLKTTKMSDLHPMFHIVGGPKASWEKGEIDPNTPDNSDIYDDRTGEDLI